MDTTNEQLAEQYRTTGCKQTRSLLVERNRGLVVSIARRYASPQWMDDAVAEGLLALVMAIDTYNPAENVGVKFSAYASLCIRNNVLSILRNEKHQRGKIKRVLEMNHTIGNEDAPLEDTVNIQKAMRDAMLDVRERQVIECRYGLNGERMTLEQTGQQLNMSRQRVHQIEMEALRLLRRQVCK